MLSFSLPFSVFLFLTQENRKSYDQSVAEALNAEKAWSELNDLLRQLQTKIAEAANTIRYGHHFPSNPIQSTFGIESIFILSLTDAVAVVYGIPENQPDVHISLHDNVTHAKFVIRLVR